MITKLIRYSRFTSSEYKNISIDGIIIHSLAGWSNWAKVGGKMGSLGGGHTPFMLDVLVDGCRCWCRVVDLV
jgi:hypothetical protein